MRILIVTIIAILSCKHSFCQSDSAKSFAILFTPIEGGIMVPLKSKKNNELPYPVNHFANDKGGRLVGNFLKLGLLYKERYGLDVFYNFSTRMTYNKSSIESYLSKSHPDYENPFNMNYYGYEPEILWKGWQVGLFYRVKLLKWLNIEPKFQVGLEHYSQEYFAYYLKDKNSNYFIEYNLTGKAVKKITPSFHYILNVSSRVTSKKSRLGIELGLKAEYFTMAPKIRYTSTETPYLQESAINIYDVKQHIEAMIIAFTFRIRY